MLRVCDLIVIGGGLVGAAISWGAHALGASVILLDEGDDAYRAARGNFGLVWVQSKGDGVAPYALWTRRSAACWPALAAAIQGTVGIEPALHQPGGLAFCLSDEEFYYRDDMLRRMQRESGDIGTRMVHREELRTMVSGLGDEVTGASFCPIDGHANPSYLLRGLHQALGSAYHPRKSVERIDATVQDFTVHAAGVSYVAPKLVIAAGLGSRNLAPTVGLKVPVVPQQGQIVITERLRKLLDFPTHTLRQTDEGTVMLGDSIEDAGFDTTTRVRTLRTIVDRNMRVFPALREASVTRAWAALRVMSPDGLPIYDQSIRYPGAFSATCHSGVTLAGAHALALAPAIMNGALPDALAAFTAKRFLGNLTS
ncbi:NAD(P)/FAD-dependent oxidoreductase [Rhodopila sp.]|uniref:NAD(P)/FAD-dependent oxidoreductase n=1 Tax=Rhodopila sp. TaxID=2480087 RepID=UPI002BC93659|nr:FAD-dependent oxidoreductase [Rhodopila sp.]HVZ10428.1 FAD-dependent oxidoreductase [Rhodopila sp.]